MKAILTDIKKDLEDLFNSDKIDKAIYLNNSINKKFVSTNYSPMYFVGNYEAKTVFVMLNPGSAIDTKYSFDTSEKKNYKNLNDFLEKYLHKHINFGKINYDKVDNFDLKQAAFLYHFKNSGLSIPDFVNEKDNEKKSILKADAKETVLMNKLQLELIPYCSVEFIGVMDNTKLAINNFNILEPHLLRIFDAIIEYDRQYVVFGAKQFYFLLYAYNIKHLNSVIFHDLKTFEIEGLKKKVNCRVVEINYKNKKIKGLIPYSFPRRDLPNAYDKMKKYGELCFQEFINIFN